MSEKFNPLAEAQNNASEDRRRFYDWVGDNSDHKNNESFRAANADMVDYLTAQHYVDDKGNIHNAENSQFIANPNNETDEEYYNRMIEEADTGSDMRFAGKGLKELAEMVKEATESNDKTLAIDARAAFDDKFISVAEKLGWEGVTTLEDGTVEDRNAIAEQRLAYYEGLMNGSDDLERRQEALIEAGNKRREAAKTSSANSTEEQTGTEAEPTEATNEAASSPEARKYRPNQYVELGGERWKVDQVIEDVATGTRKLHLVHENEKGHIKHNTVDESEATVEAEQPTDSEVDAADVSKEVASKRDLMLRAGLDSEDVDKMSDNQVLAYNLVLPKDLSEAVSGDGPDVKPLKNVNTTDTDVKPLKNVNTGDADTVQPLKNSNGSDWDPKKFAELSRKERDDEEAKKLADKKERGPLRRRLAALGAVALASIVAAGFYGSNSSDSAPRDGGRPAAAEAGPSAAGEADTDDGLDSEGERESSTEPVADTDPASLPDTNRESIDITAALEIVGSEGWNQTMLEMGIPENEWKPVLAEVGPELGEMSYPDQPDLKVAYFDAEADEWRINMPESGKMPQAALDLIEQARSN